jgi:hypothetical protein
MISQLHSCSVNVHQYPLVQATKSGTALKAVLKLSKHHFVLYMKGLLAVCPYVNSPFDSHANIAKDVAEAVSAASLTPANLNNLALAEASPTWLTSSPSLGNGTMRT